jgi:putative ABC transport system permease protein
VIRLSGRFRSALIIGGQGIRARKLRTFLSMISLFLGVLAVVTVQAGAEIASRAMLADIELQQGKDGTHQMHLPGSGTTVPIVLDTLRGKDNAAAAISVRQAIIGEPGVSPVNPGGSPFDQQRGYSMYCSPEGMCYGGGDMPPGVDTPPPGQAIELNLTGLTGDIRQFRPFRIDSGQWLDFTSEPSLAPRIVVNREAAKGLSRHRVPAELRLPGAATNATPRIIGVVNDGSPMPAAYVRADELLNWMPVSGDQTGITVQLAPDASETEQVLRARLAASGLPAGQLYSDTINSRERISDQLTLMRLIFLGLAGLVLLIGAAGILNVGLATVGERIEEFALRRAVGTPRLLLAGIVLAETLLIGLFTAAAAIGIGILGLKALGFLFGDREPFLHNVVFPWQAGVAGVIAGLIAGLLGGLIPAIRAARIPIATVMRA